MSEHKAMRPLGFPPEGCVQGYDSGFTTEIPADLEEARQRMPYQHTNRFRVMLGKTLSYVQKKRFEL